jgi:hypothetical protein
MPQYNNLRVDSELLDMRPMVATQQIDSKEIERFQNECLRPILKLQNDLIINWFLSQKPVAIILKLKDQKPEFRTKLKAFLGQGSVRGVLIGIVVGQMTNQESSFYLQNQNEINKRTIAMLAQRVEDGV